MLDSEGLCFGGSVPQEVFSAIVEPISTLEEVVSLLGEIQSPGAWRQPPEPWRLPPGSWRFMNSLDVVVLHSTSHWGSRRCESEECMLQLHTGMVESTDNPSHILHLFALAY